MDSICCRKLTIKEAFFGASRYITPLYAFSLKTKINLAIFNNKLHRCPITLPTTQEEEEKTDIDAVYL